MMEIKGEKLRTNLPKRQKNKQEKKCELSNRITNMFYICIMIIKDNVFLLVAFK